MSAYYYSIVILWKNLRVIYILRASCEKSLENDNSSIKDTKVGFKSLKISRSEWA